MGGWTCAKCRTKNLSSQRACRGPGCQVVAPTFILQHLNAENQHVVRPGPQQAAILAQTCKPAG